eukprot:SM000594S19563  [mRNA]  locus=s594:1515:2210:- [translate_table: standard]
MTSSLRKGVYDPWAFYLHAALLRQAFAHCGKFPTAASRRSLGRVSVPVWLIILSDQLLIVALYTYGHTLVSILQASFEAKKKQGIEERPIRDNQARTDDFHHVKVALYH